MASNHPAILQGAPIEKRARRAHQQQGAVSPEWVQGAVARMGEHAAGAMFGPGGLPVIRHHRTASATGGLPGIGTSGGVFLARSCAVEWQHPSAQPVPFPHRYPEADGKPQTGPAHSPISGSWLANADPYTAYGHAATAMTEDDDRAPFQPPAKPSAWPLGIALLALAGLVAAACCITTDGGFR